MIIIYDSSLFDGQMGVVIVIVIELDYHNRSKLLGHLENFSGDRGFSAGGPSSDADDGTDHITSALIYYTS